MTKGQECNKSKNRWSERQKQGNVTKTYLFLGANFREKSAPILLRVLQLYNNGCFSSST